MTRAKTSRDPLARHDQDGAPRPGVPLHHAWATVCACCSAKISGSQTVIRANLRICRDRDACKARRAGGRVAA